VEADQAHPEPQAPSEPAADAAAWAAGVEAAWAAGTRGWDRLGQEWGVPAAEAVPLPADAASVPAVPVPVRCWWDAPPWRGHIPDADFRAIVAAYVARHGSYTPDLPEREPGVLREWLRAHGYASAAAPPAAA
jgi:hypothetical protein